jgi:serine protease Do
MRFSISRALRTWVWHRIRLSLAVLSFVCVIANAGAAEAMGAPPLPGVAGGIAQDNTRQAQRTTPTVRVFQQASPAVVNLSTTKIVKLTSPFHGGGLFDDVFNFPSRRGPRSYKTHSVGSGFLIHADGYIVTNAHVVDQAAECEVIFADGTKLEAMEVAIDRRSDLAVLKVKAKRPLPYLTLGRSDDLMQGETVIAIGNPLGYAHTITTGIVSALDRELRFDQDLVYSGLIQTDASINPGNSGGPLLNILGELIGINTAIRGDAQNIGFAIPVNKLHEKLPEMLDIERIRRVAFGVHFEGPGGGTDKGVRIGRVTPETPAAAAGVRAGDVLLAIDNRPTPTFVEAFGLLARTPPAHSVKLDLLRTGGKRESVEVMLAAIPKQDAGLLMKKRFGIGVREISKADLKRLGLRRQIGLIVTSVERAAAARSGPAEGDIVTKFGGWPVSTLDDLAHLLDQVKRGDRIRIQLFRIHGDHYVRFEIVLEAE